MGDRSDPTRDGRPYTRDVNATLIPVITALGGIVVGAFLKHVLDLRAGRQAKLLDEKLKYAVAFLAAADWASRSYESVTSGKTLMVEARRSPHLLDGEDREEVKNALERALNEAHAALKDAHTAACALRLLMPELGVTPENYIELSVDAAHLPRNREAHEDARASLEASLIAAFRTSRRGVSGGKLMEKRNGGP
jgi:hypothetical protein